MVIPKGFPKSVGSVGSRPYGFPCFPHSVISTACFRRSGSGFEVAHNPVLRAVWNLTLYAGVYQQMVMLRNTLGMMLIFVSLLMASAVVSREYAQSCGIPVFLSHRCSRQEELHTFGSASRSLKSDVR